MVANVMPLSLIGQELNNTLEQLQANLDSYISNRSMTDMLQACIEQVDQLRGIFNLILFVGAQELAVELLDALQQASAGEEIDFAVVTKATTVLHRYLELTQNKDSDIPELLLPMINELRVARKKTPLPEGHFLQVNTDALPDALANQKVDETITPDTIRRVRHMYQVGLTNVLREDNVPGSARMMLRSVENIQRYSGHKPFAYLWWVERAVLTAISQEALMVTRPRKLLLGQLDRQFKAAEQDWAGTIAREAPSNLLKELLYLVSLIQGDIGNAADVKKAFKLPAMPNEKVIAKQQKMLMSRSAVTKAISDKIKTEVAISKELLETGSEQESSIRYDELLSHLATIKEALVNADMHKPISAIDEQMMQVQEWKNSGEMPSREDLSTMADAILYIESAINTVGSADDEDDEEGSFEDHKDKVIASSQLADAQRILLVEAQTGLVQAIRQTTAYVESDYDKNALADVTTHLKSASGGLVFMKLERCARIVDSCIAFFEKEIFNSNEKLNQQKLDAIADALTAMEYYIGGLMENKRYGEGMLDVAEEGLLALGYLKRDEPAALLPDNWTM